MGKKGTRPLTQEDYDRVKFLVLEKEFSYEDVELATGRFRSTISRIMRSDSYEDYKEKIRNVFLRNTNPKPSEPVNNASIWTDPSLQLERIANALEAILAKMS